MKISRQEVIENKKIGWFIDTKTGLVKQVMTITPYRERIVGELKGLNKPNTTKMKEELRKKFDKRFPNVESAYLNVKEENVHLFVPAVDAEEMWQFIKKLLSDQLDEVEQDAKNHLEASRNEVTTAFWKDVVLWLSLLKKRRGK